MTDREKSGPEKYAPPDRRAPKERSDVDQCDPAPEKLNELIRRVAGASAEEIDQVVLELQRVRDMLDGEGERLSREIARYASLRQQLMTGMKVIAENLIQWKGASVSREQPMADFKARWVSIQTNGSNEGHAG
ncbi:MAG: hypothetical protein WCD56_00510 [Pseudolabrys sp.]